MEQYATSPELTSYIIFSALSKHDIGYGRTVLDLGCGTGMLSIGSALVGSSHVLLVDCDEDALNVARENMEAMGFGHDDDEFEQEQDHEQDCSRNDDYENQDDNNDNSEEHNEYEDDDNKEEQECMVEYILAQVKHGAAAAASSSTRNDVGGGDHDIMSRGFRTKSGRGRGKRRGGRSVGGDNGESNNYQHMGGRRGDHASTRNISINISRMPLESPRDIGPLDDGIPLASGCVDTVLTNPPFGTKPGNAGIDVMFLRSAIRLATRAVYSFHKTSTREYLLKAVQGWGYQVSVVAEMKFDIPKMYKFHAKDNVDVCVDLIRVDILGSGKEGVDCVRS